MVKCIDEYEKFLALALISYIRMNIESNSHEYKGVHHEVNPGPAIQFSKWGAKTQPIFICYNFCFETLDTWKNIF